jgi:enediyne biosynthesis protein E7
MSSADRNEAAPAAVEAEFDIGSTDDTLPHMMRDFAIHGDVYRWLRPGNARETWVVSDPETIKRVLVGNHRNYTIGVGLDRVKVLVGNGIIVSEGDLWRRQHRMMQPMFQRSQIERFGPMMTAVTRQRLESWCGKADRGEPCNVTKETSEGALEVVLRAVFGADYERLCIEGGSNPFAMLSEETERDLRFAYRFRQLGKHIDAVIARRESAPSADAQIDWLAMMMASRDRDGQPMSHRELIDEVMSLIVAGHETTAAVLNSVWYLLAQHPEVEQRLHAEVDRIELPDLRLASIESLHYTHQVILEALRLYPPVWVLSRRCKHADKLVGHQAPADVDVLMSPYVVHRHPQHWADPEAFRPERFAADVIGATHRYAFIPFSAGPRHCVGETFALYEMAIHVYHVARALQLRCERREPLELEARINLRVREDFSMRLERRRP